MQAMSEIGLCLKQHLMVYRSELGHPYILQTREERGFLNLCRFKMQGMNRKNLSKEPRTSA